MASNEPHMSLEEDQYSMILVKLIVVALGTIIAFAAGVLAGALAAVTIAPKKTVVNVARSFVSWRRGNPPCVEDVRYLVFRQGRVYIAACDGLGFTINGLYYRSPDCAFWATLPEPPEKARAK